MGCDHRSRSEKAGRVKTHKLGAKAQPPQLTPRHILPSEDRTALAGLGWQWRARSRENHRSAPDGTLLSLPAEGRQPCPLPGRSPGSWWGDLLRIWPFPEQAHLTLEWSALGGFTYPSVTACVPSRASLPEACGPSKAAREVEADPDRPACGQVRHQPHWGRLPVSSGREHLPRSL